VAKDKEDLDRASEALGRVPEQVPELGRGVALVVALRVA